MFVGLKLDVVCCLCAIALVDEMKRLAVRFVLLRAGHRSVRSLTNSIYLLRLLLTLCEHLGRVEVA